MFESTSRRGFAFTRLTVRRSRVLKTLGLLFAVSIVSGCTLVRNATIATLDHDSVGDFLVDYRNQALAEKAWHCNKARFGERRHLPEFRDGFIAGYIDIATGGHGCVPALAPKKYWGWSFQCPDGKLAAQTWFEGYPYGVQVAETDGIGSWSELSTSLPPVRDPVAEELKNRAMMDVRGTNQPGVMNPSMIDSSMIDPSMIDPRATEYGITGPGIFDYRVLDHGVELREYGEVIQSTPGMGETFPRDERPQLQPKSMENIEPGPAEPLPADDANDLIDTMPEEYRAPTNAPLGRTQESPQRLPSSRVVTPVSAPQTIGGRPAVPVKFSPWRINPRDGESSRWNQTGQGKATVAPSTETQSWSTLPTGLFGTDIDWSAVEPRK